MGEYIYNLAEGAERPQQIRELVANVSIPGGGGGGGSAYSHKFRMDVCCQGFKNADPSKDERDTKNLCFKVQTRKMTLY